MTATSAAIPRFEIKFVIPEVHIDRVLQTLAVHPSSFTPVFRPRLIRTVYFDTYQYDSYRSNLWGISARTKVRYRWYDGAAGPESGHLEVKCKRNRVNWKYQFPIRLSPHRPEFSWRTVYTEILQQLPPQGKLWLQTHPQPTLLLQYRREYFLSADRRIRATVDTHQRGFDQRTKPYPNVRYPINLPQTVILELKGSHQDHEALATMIEHFPFRVSRHSKYVTGLKSA